MFSFYYKTYQSYNWRGETNKILSHTDKITCWKFSVQRYQMRYHNFFCVYLRHLLSNFYNILLATSSYV